MLEYWHRSCSTVRDLLLPAVEAGRAGASQSLDRPRRVTSSCKGEQIMLRRVGLVSTVAVAFVLVFSGSTAHAQKPVNLAQVVSETFTIEAIDHSARMVTL